jgi:ribosomal protein S18 acetylase RimI-like enzyme
MVRKLNIPGEGQRIRFRSATRRDFNFIRHLSAEVFDIFGDYGTFLPRYLDHPAVQTTVCEVDGKPCGFIMVALVIGDRILPWERDLWQGLRRQEDAESGSLDAEVVAIAVEPGYQGRGLGRMLMEQALTYVSRCPGPVRSIQLNVAHTNSRAMEFFRRQGFQLVDAADGTYPRGQRSIRMALPNHDPTDEGA